MLCCLTALATPPDRPPAKHGLHDVRGPSVGGGPPRRGGGAGKGQALHSQTEVGGLTAGGRAKVSHFYWQCHTLTWQGWLRDTNLFSPMLTISGNCVVGRRGSLELILPRAQLFQKGADSLQQWFISVEQTLAELRNAERVMLHISEATDRGKVGNLPCIENMQIMGNVHGIFLIDMFCFHRQLLQRYRSKPQS